MYVKDVLQKSSNYDYELLIKGYPTVLLRIQLETCLYGTEKMVEVAIEATKEDGTFSMPPLWLNQDNASILINTSLEHPQADGLVEQVNRTIKLLCHSIVKTNVSPGYFIFHLTHSA